MAKRIRRRTTRRTRVGKRIVSLTDQLPTYKKTLEEKIHALGRGHSKGVKAASETLRDLGKEIATTVPGAKPPNDAKESQAVPGSNPSPAGSGSGCPGQCRQMDRQLFSYCAMAFPLDLLLMPPRKASMRSCGS